MDKTCTILIACYDDVERKALQDILVGRAFQIRTVRDGNKVINAVKRHNPVLLVMDTEFPKSQTSGWEIARTMRQIFGSSPLIFLLIHPGHGYRYLEPEYKSLYDHILVMPIDLGEVLQGVRKLLGVYPWGKDWDSQAAKEALRSV